MLKIICGDNEIASREYFVNLKKELKEKGYEILTIDSGKFLEEISSLKDNLSLFSSKKAYFTENVFKKYSRNKKFKEILKEFEEKDELLVIWEKLTSREISVDKKYIIEFKLPENIFKLLDSFYPGNFKSFHKFLEKVSEKVPEYLIFYMLVQRVHLLMAIKFGINMNLPSWQLKKLKFQANLWTIDQLYSAVEGLFKVDVRLKTSTTPFSLIDSLDILAGIVL